MDGHGACLFVVLDGKLVACKEARFLRFDIDIECGIRNFGPRVEHDEHHIVAGGPCIDEGVGVLTLG